MRSSSSSRTKTGYYDDIGQRVHRQRHEASFFGHFIAEGVDNYHTPGNRRHSAVYDGDDGTAFFMKGNRMFYTIRIQRKKDGTETRNISPFTNHDDAEIFYHKCLAADMGNKDNESVSVAVMSESCVIDLSKLWVSPAESETTE